MAKRKIIRVHGVQLRWEVIQDLASGRYVARAPAVKLVVEGETWSDLTDTIQQALNLLFADLLETGELERFFNEHGWTPEIPIPAGQMHLKIDLPWAAVLTSQRDFARAASQ